MRTAVTMVGIVGLCCGAHLFAVPLLATGILSSVVGGLAGLPGLVVAGVVLAVATVFVAIIRVRAIRGLTGRSYDVSDPPSVPMSITRHVEGWSSRT